MDLLDAGRILLGLVLLVGGGELLVRGASSLAARLGLSPLVIGLTVVSVATSSPELAVTVGATLDGQPDLAVGNVVGSNIANVLLILGISALVLPLSVREQLVRFDVPFLVVLSGLLLVLAFDGGLSTLEGVVLLTAMVVHTALTVVISRRRTRAARSEGDSGERTDDGSAGKPPARLLVSLLLVLGGVGLLVVGADQLVTGAVSVAEALGVSGLVVGLTVVAVGTSLPELAASVIAAVKGERDLAVGNVVGSCIANIGLVLGLPAVISSGGLPVPGAALALDIPLMLAASVALLPVVLTDFCVARWEGALFIALYAAYVGYVVLDAINHDALEGFTLVMVVFVLPLVLVTLVSTVVFEAGVRRGRREEAEARSA
ncbi:calcium/sodium antiporter [Ornithinimicrobium pekingense]|uniref:Sodium:calcium antiporter n=1 Tax=Ornithinimicrobium pekingense TaxID=384677 RepID=A0ABQ2F9D4_9MICO|nr:calcium/sodium antiporter [Ornithinimicrobium pekingense]GGK71477.1 sodium:calcium antiporter [Ornithinimicrobium pekingense]